MLHQWSIAEREYTRHEQRRGRRHAFTSLRPAHTALVVVDMVPFFVDENPYAAGIVPNINRIAAAVRAADGVVAFVVPADMPPSNLHVELFGATVAGTYAASGGSGPLRERLAPALDVHDGDLVVHKTAASAFFPERCQLPGLLRVSGVDTVIVTGTVANVCCESTVRDANTLGYRPIMVADANAATTDAELNATLHTVYRSFGDVRTTDEVLALIGEG